MVSAWASANRLVLGQRAVAEKSNEITAIPSLLDLLVLKGCIVTIDAMGCQTDIARKVVTVLIATMCWFLFLVGHVLNNVRGFGS